MTNNAEDALLDFLRSDENLRFVLDILKRGKRIRRVLIRDFWTELDQYLRGRALKCPSSPLNTLKSEPELIDGQLDKCDAGLYYWNEADEHAKQLVNFSIFHEREGETVLLFYGLVWENMVERDSPLMKLKPVKTLREQLQSAGFKKSEWCLGYKIPWEYETIDHLLATVATGRDSLFGEIGDVFLPFVRDTAEMVKEVNKAVAAASKW